MGLSMKYQLRIIKWADSYTIDGWNKEINLDPCIVISVGWVVKEDDIHIALAPTISNFEDEPDSKYAEVLVIPKVSIISSDLQ